MINFYYPVPPDTWISQHYKPDHRAYDFGVMTGTTINSMADGEVTTLQKLSNSYGWYLIVSHAEDYSSLYAHLSGFLVSLGDMVTAGSPIALSGTTGNSSGPHLHCELRLNNTPFDYLSLLSPSFYEEPVDFTFPDFPTLPIFRIAYDGLRIRIAPNVNSMIIGHVNAGDEVPVIKAIKNGNNIWAQCGYHQYCAIKYRNKLFGKFI